MRDACAPADGASALQSQQLFNVITHPRPDFSGAHAGFVVVHIYMLHGSCACAEMIVLTVKSHAA